MINRHIVEKCNYITHYLFKKLFYLTRIQQTSIVFFKTVNIVLWNWVLALSGWCLILSSALSRLWSLQVRMSTMSWTVGHHWTIKLFHFDGSTVSRRVWIIACLRIRWWATAAARAWLVWTYLTDTRWMVRLAWFAAGSGVCGGDAWASAGQSFIFDIMDYVAGSKPARFGLWRGRLVTMGGLYWRGGWWSRCYCTRLFYWSKDKNSCL